ncbi:MAG: DNA polymerase III subunit gamma/tau [Ferruginibacter sp.]
MDKFIVSARKYRPQNFNTVVGQSHITTTLKNAINNNQLAHAFLFCGPRGVGKTTCARILAKTINCENRTADGEACNTCNSCVSFDNGTSLNIHELDAASNNSVDDIRALVEQVRFAPQAGEYKVYIVDEVHMLSAAAFNAFLKTLEEPPPYAIFILATTEKHKILPTILSRCQIFDFKRITINDTIEHLHEICEKEDITAEKAALHIIAQKSEGAMRDSLSILDKIVSFTDGHLTYANTLEHLNILDEDYYFKLLEFLQAQQLSDSLLLLDTILQKGFETDTFIDGFTEFARNLLVSKDAKAAVLLEVADDFREKYISWAKKTDTGWILAALNLLTEANTGLKTARNKKLFTEMLLIKLSYLQQAIELQQGDAGKKKLTDNTKPVAFRALPVLQVKSSAAAPSKTKKPVAEASLIIESPQVMEPAPAISRPAAKAAPVEEPATPAATLGSLAKLREKIAQQNNNTEQKAIPLFMEKLEEGWQEYIEILKANKSHSSVTIFKSSSLSIVDDNCFDIMIEQDRFQKFIEAEREGLLEHFKNKFSNKNISYKLSLNPNAETETEQGPAALTGKQKFQLLSEQYPNIRLLKEKLRLDIG